MAAYCERKKLDSKAVRFRYEMYLNNHNNHTSLHFALFVASTGLASGRTTTSCPSPTWRTETPSRSSQSSRAAKPRPPMGASKCQHSQSFSSLSHSALNSKTQKVNKQTKLVK